MSRPSAMAPSTEPPSESSTTRGAGEIVAVREHFEIARRVGGDGAARRNPQLALGAAGLGGALLTQSKRIGSVRSATSADAGNSVPSAAEASAMSNAKKRLILPPYSAAEPLFLAWSIATLLAGLWRL